MKASRRIVTTFRLPEAVHRRLRLVAAQRGTSIQRALEKSLQIWLRTGDQPEVAEEEGLALQGILSGLDVHGLRARERRNELTKDARRFHK